MALGIHFSWTEEAKQVLVLWRDTLFEFQKARILQKEEKIGDEEIVKLHATSQDVLRKAADEQIASFTALERIGNSSRAAKRKLDQWRLLNSPWPTYREQIEDLGRQPAVLIKQYSVLLEVSDSMMRIDTSLQDVIKRGKTGIDATLSLAQQTIDAIYNLEDSTKRIFELESIEQLIRANPTFENYNEAIELELRNYNSVLQFPIVTIGGIIKYKDLNPARHIRLWLEGEIHPGLNDAIEIMENTSSTFKMALVNVRNRLLLFTQEGLEKAPVNSEELIQPIQDAIEDIRTWRAEYKSIRNTVLFRMDDNFYANQIYSLEREFLPLSYTRSLTQMKLDENQLFTRVKTWIRDKTRFLQDVRTTVLKEESLSDAERIIRFVKSRRIQDDQYQYDSIFTAEGYIGEFFLHRKKTRNGANCQLDK